MGTIIINQFVTNPYTLHAFYDFKTSQPWAVADRADDWRTYGPGDDGVNTISEEATEGWRIYSNGPDIGLWHITLLPSAGIDIKITVVMDSVTSGSALVYAGGVQRDTITTAGTYTYEYTSVADDDFFIKRGSACDWVCRSVKVEKI